MQLSHKYTFMEYLSSTDPGKKRAQKSHLWTNTCAFPHTLVYKTHITNYINVP